MAEVSTDLLDINEELDTMGPGNPDDDNEEEE